MHMIVLLFVSMASAACAQEIHMYSYTDSEGYSAQWIMDESTGRNKFVHGSYISSLVNCEGDRLRVCLRGEGFVFSLPAEELQKGLEWSADEYLFLVDDRVELSFLGTSINAWKIISHPSNLDIDRSVFFYSNDLGLVGFALLSAEEAIDALTGEISTVLTMRPFWLASKVGYFAGQR